MSRSHSSDCGGYPSTTGNESGGNRCNNDCYDDDDYNNNDWDDDCHDEERIDKFDFIFTHFKNWHHPRINIKK